MAEKLTRFDPAEGLTSDEAIAAFMADAFSSEDAGYIAHALGVVARAKGMTDAMHGELLAVIAMAAQTNRLAEALRVPVDPAFEI